MVKWLLLDASEFDIQHFADEANQYIEHCVAEGKSVLIHCAMVRNNNNMMCEM